MKRSTVHLPCTFVPYSAMAVIGSFMPSDLRQVR